MWLGIPVDQNIRCGTKYDGMIGHGPICYEAIMMAARHRRANGNAYFACLDCDCNLHGFMPMGMDKITAESLTPGTCYRVGDEAPGPVTYNRFQVLRALIYNAHVVA